MGTIWGQIIHFPLQPDSDLQLQSALFIGGASKRMGHPKSLLKKQGQYLGSYLIGILYEAFQSQPILVGQGPMPTPWNLQSTLLDEPGFQGPLAGFAALAKHHPQQAFLILAVDLFYFEQTALSWLLAKIQERPDRAIWPKLPQRSFGEPMAAYYPAQALEIMTESGKQGEFALHRALPVANRWEPDVPKDLVASFKNVNRPEDLPYSTLDL